MERVLIPRLNQSEVRGLGRAANQLAAMATVLRSTSWGPAPAMLVNVEQIYEAIALVYNKCEHTLPEIRKARAEAAAGSPPAEDVDLPDPSLVTPAPPTDEVA